MRLSPSGIFIARWLLLCVGFGSFPICDAGAGAIIALAKPAVQVLAKGLTTVAKSGIIQKTISYGTAGALAGAGDAAGDYISARVQANNNIELANMQQEFVKQLQVAVPPKPSVTITDVTDEYNKAQNPNDLHSLLVQLINSTIQKAPAPLPAPLLAPVPLAVPALKPAVEPLLPTHDGEKVFLFYYIIGSVSVCTMFVFCACCVCCVKILFSDKIEKDFKVKFLNHI